MAKYWKIILSSGHTASLSRSMHCHRHNHDHHLCFQQFFNHQIFFLFQNFSDLIIIINWTSFFSSSDSSSRKKERKKQGGQPCPISRPVLFHNRVVPTYPGTVLSAASMKPFPKSFKGQKKSLRAFDAVSQNRHRRNSKKWEFTILVDFIVFFIFILTQEIISQNKCHIISNGPHIPMTPNISAIEHL